MKSTPGPWIRRSIPGHLFELVNTAGEIVLRIRGGMMPSLHDARLLELSPVMVETLRNVSRHFVYVGEEDLGIATEVSKLLTRIDGKD